MIKNIIFDMDGVLIDSENGIRTACIEMLKRHGVNAAEPDFLPFTGMGEDRFIGGVAEKYGLAYEQSMKAEAYQIYDEIADKYVVLFDRIKELVHELKTLGYRIAVASAADYAKVKINLRCMGLSYADFGAIVTGSDVSKLKPDPMIFLTAAEKIGAVLSETLVVEDAVSGCKAAKAAGMTCIGVMSTFDGETLKNAGADFVVEKTRDMLEVLKQL